MNIIKNKGFTLIEMMIAILIGTLIVAAAIAIYVSVIKGSSDTLKSTQLNQDLGLAMTIMTNDIRRAGYWGGAVIESNATENPFTKSDASTNTYTNIEVNGSCITYTYDTNTYPDHATALAATGSSIVNSNEYFGFRLNNGTIEMKDRGSTTHGCNDPNAVWSDMLDSKRIKVTQLSFDLSGSTCVKRDASGAISTGAYPCSLSSGETGVEYRNVAITLKAEVRDDSGIHTEFDKSSVTVRNNRMISVP